MNAHDAARFDWIEDTFFNEAACITLIEGVDLDHAVWAFGGNPEHASTEDLVEALEDLPEEPTAALRQVGDWLIVVENNGFEGSRPEVLQRLTVGGAAVSAFWNVNAVTQFSYAADGEILLAFEALFPEHREGTDPELLDRFGADLPWPDLNVGSPALMLALAARITGFTLEQEHLDGEFLVVPLLPWMEDVAGGINPLAEGLTYEDPELSYALQYADDETLRAVARAAARQAAEVAGLADDPALAVVSRGPVGASERAELDRMARELRPTNRWIQFRAVAAARQAVGPDALTAAFRAITEAGYAVQTAGADPAALRAAIRAALGDRTPPSGSGGVQAIAGDQPWDAYRWLGEHWLGWAGSLTFVRGRPLAEVATAMGLDLNRATRGPVTLSTARATWLRTAGDWVVMLEPSPRFRPLEPLLSRLSTGGEAVHLMWSANGGAEFWSTVDGQVRTTFGVFSPDRRSGADPHGLDQVTADLPMPFPQEHGGRQTALLLVLVERLTGLVVAPDWLDAEWLRVPES